MEEKLSGIVLFSVCYGENDKILTVYTLESGIVSARIKGVQKAGAKLKFASEPFCFAEFIFSKTGDKRLVIGASLIDSFYPIRENIVKYYSAFVMLEFVKKFAKEEMVSKETFVLLLESLKKVAYTDINPKIYTVRFLLSALKVTGYALKTENCFKCGNEISNKTFFDYTSGAFYCEKCFFGEGREINLSTYQTLKDIEIKDDFEEILLNKSLKLLDFYINNKTEENVVSLKELINISFV